MQILKKLGLVKISEQEAYIKSLEENNKFLEVRYNKLFNWDLEQQDIPSYQQYKRENQIPLYEIYNINYFREYYKKYHTCEYQANRIRNLSMHPKLLNAFLMELTKFDFQEIATYMSEVSWTWNDNDRTPTIEELKDCVITLLPMDDYENKENAFSSGGFTVNLFYKNNGDGFCKITFNKAEKYV